MILVDTSAWLDFFHGAGRGESIVDHLLAENQVAVCGPVLTEIHRGLRNESERKSVMSLLDGCQQLSQPDRLWDEAGALGFLVRKKQGKPKTIDLLIACYALAHGMALLTFDSDFKKIQGSGVPRGCPVFS